MDFKTETQLRQEIADAWKLVDQYKRAAEINAAERDKLAAQNAQLRDCMVEHGTPYLGHSEQWAEALTATSGDDWLKLA